MGGDRGKVGRGMWEKVGVGSGVGWVSEWRWENMGENGCRQLKVGGGGLVKVGGVVGKWVEMEESRRRRLKLHVGDGK